MAVANLSYFLLKTGIFLKYSASGVMFSFKPKSNTLLGHLFQYYYFVLL